MAHRSWLTAHGSRSPYISGELLHTPPLPAAVLPPYLHPAVYMEYFMQIERINKGRWGMILAFIESGL